MSIKGTKNLNESEKFTPILQSSLNDINREQINETAKAKYPKIVFLIIINEFCERFSFYGLRTVLYLFFVNFLELQKDTATAIYHAFTTLCYFTPILGAILADGYIGLYKTILVLSIFYFVGELILTLTSMKPLGAPNLIGPCIGLVIIAIGTGGIKLFYF
jgi:dipeptide/tripeptide permease